MNVIILYRPVDPKELALIEASGFHEFPPRFPEQPIFYPVLNEEYAVQIARACTGEVNSHRLRAATLKSGIHDK